MNNQNKQLYRDPINGKLGGVCAGLAEYFSVEVWLIRLIVISAFLFTAGFLVFIAYTAAYFILDEMPEQRKWQQSIYQKHNVKKKAWEYGASAAEILENSEIDLNTIESEIEKMENYVTSFAFKMNNEFTNQK
ncbi:envelope stress response membrane protein PspC [Psychromonas sp. MME2]|uniref:envelope stress response membrane protein PspC n=1 Tax=unclassified Psychromonas TaxID=2614957 RepID=UPI00339C6F46